MKHMSEHLILKHSKTTFVTVNPVIAGGVAGSMPNSKTTFVTVNQ